MSEFSRAVVIGKEQEVSGDFKTKLLLAFYSEPLRPAERPHLQRWDGFTPNAFVMLGLGFVFEHDGNGWIHR